MVERIEEKLRPPGALPHGWPIDPAFEQAENKELAPLADLKVGQEAEIVRLAEHDGELLHWFYDEGFVPGAQVVIREAQPAAGQFKVLLSGNESAIGEKGPLRRPSDAASAAQGSPNAPNAGEAHVDSGEAERAEQALQHQPRVPLGCREQPRSVSRSVGELLLGQREELGLDAGVVSEQRLNPVDRTAISVVDVTALEVELRLAEGGGRQLDRDAATVVGDLDCALVEPGKSRPRRRSRSRRTARVRP